MPPNPTVATGIRGAYEALGVQGFYEAHGHEYSNPHNDQIVKAISLLMSSQQFEAQAGPLRVLDLACGSGEATLALQAWATEQQQQGVQPGQQQGQQGAAQGQQDGLPPQQQQGQQQQQQRQQQQGQQQQQAQQHVAQQVKQRQGRRQGRQARGGGSACPPSALLHITACDPYTQEAYERRTGGSVHPWSYQDIAEGCLAGHTFDLCVCSFALHLCDPSSLFITLYQLACHCRWLAVLAPHKQPHVTEQHGWEAVRAQKVDRVHVRLYSSLNWGQQQD